MTTEQDIARSTDVIRRSFATVAEGIDLNQENCPTHPAYTTCEMLRQMAEKGVRLFGLFEGTEQVGFVAIEKASDDLFYVGRLAVLPDHRHKGHGKRLMDFAFDHVRSAGGKVVSIGIIEENAILKRWYGSFGFRQTGLKRFEHLPFTVCFMEMPVGR